MFVPVNLASGATLSGSSPLPWSSLYSSIDGVLDTCYVGLSDEDPSWLTLHLQQDYNIQDVIIYGARNGASEKKNIIIMCIESILLY